VVPSAGRYKDTARSCTSTQRIADHTKARVPEVLKAAKDSGVDVISVHWIMVRTEQETPPERMREAGCSSPAQKTITSCGIRR